MQRVDEQINIHDKSIPCWERFGVLGSQTNPCSWCIYNSVCHEEDIPKAEKIYKELKIEFPEMFNGTIQTKEQYLELVRQRFVVI